MMAFTTSDGKAHGTLEAAQKAEINIIIAGSGPQSGELAEWVIKNKEKLIDILTTKPSSKPRARKVNGGTKTRTKKHIAEQHTLPFEAANPEPAA